MEKEISFNDVPQAIAYLIGKIDAIEQTLQQNSEQPNTQHDRWLNTDELHKYHPDKPAKSTIFSWVKKSKYPIIKVVKGYALNNQKSMHGYNQKIKLSIMSSSIIQLAKECPDVTINVKAGELLEMAQFCVSEAKKSLEQQITDANTETYPSRQKTAEIFNVNLSTLHRWAKSGLLVPIEIAGTRRYRTSDINRILGKGAVTA